MYVDFLIDVFQNNKDKPMMVWKEKEYSYGWLLQRMEEWGVYVRKRAVPKGSVVAIYGDYSPNSVALFLALIGHSCTIIPLTDSVKHKMEEFLEIGQAEFLFELDSDDTVKMSDLNRKANHPFLVQLKSELHPGLILFSSGSTGRSKAAVHDLTGLLEKYKVQRKALRTISFLLYDHIGGVNTMLHTLSNAGCIYTVSDRQPDTVLAAISKYEIELLPTSPTFINLILLSEAYKRYDLSKLKMMSYGTEPMPESTLKRIGQILPHVKLLQTYGLSEVGILRSKSKSSDSLWVKIGGEGFDTRIVDGMLEIKSQSAMLGYLNAPSAFTEDGYFQTGDMVEVDGEYIRILGRKSEIINVGGQKVYPAEVESVILTVENVADVTVHAEKNLITGNIVCATVTLHKEEERKEVVRRIKSLCKQQLEAFKIPVRIYIMDGVQYSSRFKKLRSAISSREG
ncbi:fatty acid--CoA ligase family protein [Paenibacillus thiaminolyticus]|uniref:ANL family adenylate-forming protein n=1 Tax=Paenibacillus thiaminolyticus TaxID=49283 RepID=UPI001164D4D5|nr:fatty acid--CoA ligase family protein [Paenibacillus thiaminolyticus]NGP60486.1 long-chain fatty acid--CoA ligase [Paenibacillus thiaminolyticus]WCR25877.1 fatty acid--CoA ligase family protein [Paenibacillus thiaminolyticus]